MYHIELGLFIKAGDYFSFMFSITFNFRFKPAVISLQLSIWDSSDRIFLLILSGYNWHFDDKNRHNVQIIESLFTCRYNNFYQLYHNIDHLFSYLLLILFFIL